MVIRRSDTLGPRIRFLPWSGLVQRLHRAEFVKSPMYNGTAEQGLCSGVERWDCGPLWGPGSVWVPYGLVILTQLRS